ncbi:MAG TPA: ABC transporter ATP-binding protein [Anaerolinea thermolimosa]|uniref:ABC transporter ATP-binding protein n=1 Tax=Anaerolinea thermolimosa TaxID=229919 RepID=A0A3D1JFS6_9CHLR|nr:ABC transporter ATP-binding protein [Anaerolinea thermolimosa]GAP08430.1 ABC-type cobalamin/Fe3+-siderophores transport systems, ATPase components [Anaerolinea thermolimosa]HCE17372.1 ABC transporter ATP-binding protein [Anaerolinea thermolimosa]
MWKRRNGNYPVEMQTTPMLRVEALEVRYGERRALKGVSFSVERGEVFGVIGPNGAGKTTLIRALSGVVEIAGGEVWIAGRDVRHLNEQERARLVAVVPQARNLPPAFTGQEMVQLGRTPYLNWLGQFSARDWQGVRRAMERAHVLDLADRRLGDLSGGEQQRLLLARALAQEAPLLLLDEPTTHLDLQYQISLLDAVADLAKREGLTVVMTLHDLNLISRYADRLCLLVEGEIKALGTPEMVLEPELLSQVYHVPLQRIRSERGGRPIILPTVL